MRPNQPANDSTKIGINSPADITLDPGFAEFYGWAKSAAVPVVLVSR